MRIVLAGASGFLGRALVEALLAEHHDLLLLSRGPSPASDGPGARPAPPARVTWTPDGTTGPWAASLAGAEVIVNLAGEPIGAGRWTASRKARILDSRILATRSLVEAAASLQAPPRLLISASAIGFYGVSDDRPLTESSPPGRNFLSEVCLRWEAEASRAEKFGVRVVLLRTGVVLARDGGALPKMLAPFRLFGGGPLASGRQYLSWIHRDDWVALARWTMTVEGLSGPINLTAPAPATNREFSRTIGRTLRRPSWLPVPAFAMRLALGEMADELLVGGQRVIPARALGMGFAFRHPALGPAIASILA